MSQWRSNLDAFGHAHSGAIALARPHPRGADLCEYAAIDDQAMVMPDHNAWEWMRATFIEESSPLVNGEHAHLRFARVGFLWTNIENRRQGRAIVGMAEMPMARGGKWAKGRHDLQLRQWFGGVPDFVITLSAPYAAAAEDARFCALVEHELLHCAQARDAFGVPKFSRSTGKPIFAIRGHDVEEFTSIVRRYGSKAAGVEEMVAAALAKPLLAGGAIAGACGNCLARAA